MNGDEEHGFLWVRGLRKEYSGSAAAAVEQMDLDVGDGAFLTLLGPSGCGKTTTLRMLAGLERPTAGTVGVGNEVLSDAESGHWVPPNRRNFGMVFQSYAVWPHMTVWENAAFPLGRRARWGPDDKAAVYSALERVGLDRFASRSAHRLSGGQQQRVAIARALVQSPRVLLLDEPLSNLDASLRRQMRLELKDLQRDLGVTTVYVTHDQEEAFALSDRVVVMKSGRVEQEGSPADIHDSPTTLFVADFLGGRITLHGTVEAVQRESVLFVQDSRGRSPIRLQGEAPPAGSRGTAVCMSKRARLLTDDRENCLTGVVERVVFEGDHYTVSCRLGETPVEVVQVAQPDLGPGDQCQIQFPFEHTRFVATHTDQAGLSGAESVSPKVGARRIGASG